MNKEKLESLRSRTNQELVSSFPDAMASGKPFVHLISNDKMSERLGENVRTMYIVQKRTDLAGSTEMSAAAQHFLGMGSFGRTLRCTQSALSSVITDEQIQAGQVLSGYTVRLVQKTSPESGFDHSHKVYPKGHDLAGEAITSGGAFIYESTQLVESQEFTSGNLADIILPVDRVEDTEVSE